jgi:hypothetical protein
VNGYASAQIENTNDGHASMISRDRLAPDSNPLAFALCPLPFALGVP